MKRRFRRAINFFAFNLLFFSLYLNFIHNDQGIPVAGQPAKATALATGTKAVDHLEKYIDTKAANHEQTAVSAAKLSIN